MLGDYEEFFNSQYGIRVLDSLKQRGKEWVEEQLAKRGKPEDTKQE